MGHGIFDNLTVTTTAGIHHKAEETLEDTVAYKTYRFVLEGDYKTLKQWRDSEWAGDDVTYQATWMASGQTASATIPEDRVISAMSLTRREADIGELTFIVKAYPRSYVGQMDFEVVPTDIHMWRVRAPDESRPNLSIIRMWEKMKDGTQEEVALYDSFQYFDATGEKKSIKDEANAVTLTLAEMIRRGVESFNTYLPTLQCTWNFAMHPGRINGAFSAGELLGRICNVEDMAIAIDGCDFANGYNSKDITPIMEFGKLPGKYILCTGDNCVGNSDGSYTVTRSFTKFYDIEGQLYLDADGKPHESPGPYIAPNI